LGTPYRLQPWSIAQSLVNHHENILLLGQVEQIMSSRSELDKSKNCNIANGRSPATPICKLAPNLWPTLLILGAGCQWILPVNIDNKTTAYREPIDKTDGAVFYWEQNLEDGLWLEIQRINEPGVVGGYLSNNKNHTGALIIILPGASTFFNGGAEEKARTYHRKLAAYHQAGYLTWSLVVRECGTAYGLGDLHDLTEALNWLKRSGKRTLGIERIYFVGYSSGATLATMVNRRIKVDALVAIAGITQPNQFEAMWNTYYAISQLFPQNTGICQLMSTLEYYGPPGSPKWDNLDSVKHLDRFLAPMLFVHSTDDFVFYTENTLALQKRYQEQTAAGQMLPEMEFIYLPGASHFVTPITPEISNRILEFLNRFENPAPQ
jgi:alpha/beta superfamily hydrolase